MCIIYYMCVIAPLPRKKKLDLETGEITTRRDHVRRRLFVESDETVDYGYDVPSTMSTLDETKTDMTVGEGAAGGVTDDSGNDTLDMSSAGSLGKSLSTNLKYRISKQVLLVDEME